MLNIMSKCAESFSFWGTLSLRTPTGTWLLDHTGGLPIPQLPIPQLPH